MKLLAKGGAIFDRINEAISWFISGLLAFTLLSVCCDVIFRSLPIGSLFWVMEIDEYILLYITFLGAAWVLKREGHVKMDLVLSRLKPATQARLDTITSILGAIVCLVVAWYGAQTTWDLFRTGYYEETMLSLPTFHLHAVVTLGCFLFCIQFLRRIYGYRGSWRASLSEEKGS